VTWQFCGERHKEKSYIVKECILKIQWETKVDNEVGSPELQAERNESWGLAARRCGTGADRAIARD
jgi:hypothetical protein